MRKPIAVIILTMAFLALSLAFALSVAHAQPTRHMQAHHPYEPFTIEVSVEDR